MSTEKHETQEFMKAYSGLKSAAASLEEMARQQEPDLDKMLVEVKKAKDYYDKCSSVIEGIKAQVESLLGESNSPGGGVENSQLNRRTDQQRQTGSDFDDEIPF
jgi:hypothetical protein